MSADERTIIRVNPDLDDTVARPARSHRLVVDVESGLEDTVQVRREPSGAPRHSTDAPMDTVVVAPPALVEPSWSPPPSPDSAVPDVSDNVWFEPLPQKPLPFRIRLDDGTLVPLDQPVYLGRNPSVPRIHPGGVPLLVTLASPQRELSSTHLELTTVGGAVVASDLKSANGSVVRVPGAAPHTLVGGESTVVIPGTTIELGDGNSIEVLAPELPGVDQD